jgi:putative ABC transport system permease protein
MKPSILARVAVGIAGLAVPVSYRERFREEWLSELWHLREQRAPYSKVAARTFGVFLDAVETRRLLPPSKEKRRNAMGMRDLRLAWRSFGKRPGWTFFVLATLTVGIGANIAIFGLVEAVLLRPLRYPAPDRLVKIQGLTLATGEPSNISPGTFYDFAERTEVFESMGAHGWVGFFTVAGDFEPERVAGSSVTAGFFETLGVPPLIGRIFTEEEDRPGAPLTVIVTHTFWQTRLGGSTAVLGKTIRVNAEPHEIVGVLPADYTHPEPNPQREPLLYTLYQFDRADLSQTGRFIRAIGRLRDGRSLDEGRAELVAFARRLEEDDPESNTGRGAYVVDLKEAIVAGSRKGLLVLYAAVGSVLLIVCANLANLQLAQGVLRRKGLAIQSALGAGRGALVRQLLIESWLLSLTGGLLGLLLASSARGLLAQRAIPRAVEMELDWTVLVFAVVLSSLTAILFGLAPALSLASKNLRSVLLEGGDRGSSSRTDARRILIGVEVALSLVLLVSAGLLVRSLVELRSVTPGFRADRVLTLSLSLPLARYDEGEQIPFYQRLYERIQSLPGVRAVGGTNILPLSDNYSNDAFQIDVRPAAQGDRPSAEARSVSDGYFEAMGIPLLRGRLFDERDFAGSARVVVISESMAEKFWPGEDPLGARITYNRGVADEGKLDVGGTGSRELVGIVGDVKHLELGEDRIPMFYTPQPQEPSFHTMTLVVRASSGAEALASGISRELASLDPEIPLYSVRSLSEVLEGSVSEERFRARVLGIFALVALGLAALGVYAVMGLSIAQREREIGIRMALGAGAKDVVRMLVIESMSPVLWGLAIGGVGAFFLSRALRSLLFRIEPWDPATFAGVIAILGATALAAALVPTLRAAQVDPVTTLRSE